MYLLSFSTNKCGYFLKCERCDSQRPLHLKSVLLETYLDASFSRQLFQRLRGEVRRQSSS